MGVASAASSRDACSIDPAEFGLTARAPSVLNLTADAVKVGELLTAVLALRPDVVVLCAQAPVVAAVLAAARARDVNARAWLATSVLSDAHTTLEPLFSMPLIDVVTDMETADFATARLAGDASCDVLMPMGCPRQLAANYTAAFGTPLPTEAAAAFAALSLLIQAATLTGSIDPAALSAAMRGRYFDTVLGRVTLGYGSRQNSGPALVRQVRVASGVGGSVAGAAGGLVTLVPLGYATGALAYPAPTWGVQRCAASGGCGDGGACGDDGACRCRLGYGGGRCTVAYGVPVAAVASVLLVAGLAAAVAVGRARWHADRQLARQAVEQRVMRAIADSAASMHGRVLAYVVHEIGARHARRPRDSSRSFTRVPPPLAAPCGRQPAARAGRDRAGGGGRLRVRHPRPAHSGGHVGPPAPRAGRHGRLAAWRTRPHRQPAAGAGVCAG